MCILFIRRSAGNYPERHKTSLLVKDLGGGKLKL